jgi:hypothetical protein
MRRRLIAHLHDLPMPPVIDVLGKWIHCRNARTATTSMGKGPLKHSAVLRSFSPPLWETIWKLVIVPQMEDITIFTFVRNPWSRICSAFYQCRDRARTSENKISPQWQFNEWVKQVLAIHGPAVNRHFAEQYDTAYFEGERFGFVGRFENIEEDWESIAARLAISPKLPHWNSARHGRYCDHYDDDSRQIIAEMYQRDIKAFGYEFGHD